MTGDPRYYDMCVRHLRFMRKLCVRGDGLYRHSPLDEAAWGRGNGFPALGLALTLSEMPADHPLRPEVLDAFRAHIEALSPHQDATGMWHQIIDRPESYRELSATCMITFAVARGVRRGWLDRERYEPNVRRAWPAINARVADDGSLVDVCTGTGKQRSLRAYYDRPAILGRDARGGAMALLAATEVAALEASR
jgi:rhamnogalacturonyl hydrolase YesR